MILFDTKHRYGHAIDDLGEKMLAKTILIIPEFHSKLACICWSTYSKIYLKSAFVSSFFFAALATGGKNAKLGFRNYLICVMKYH